MQQNGQVDYLDTGQKDSFILYHADLLINLSDLWYAVALASYQLIFLEISAALVCTVLISASQARTRPK